jgi:hypothetical protein
MEEGTECECHRESFDVIRVEIISQLCTWSKLIGLHTLNVWCLLHVNMSHQIVIPWPVRDWFWDTDTKTQTLKSLT